MEDYEESKDNILIKETNILKPLRPASIQRSVKIPRGRERIRTDDIFPRRLASTNIGFNGVQKMSLFNKATSTTQQTQPKRESPLIPKGYMFGGKLRL
jgi:hypothetical protein